MKNLGKVYNDCKSSFGVCTMEYDYIRQRITQLREQKGVAEYRMSMELGHSRNYIHNITNGKSRPSIEEFLYICEYLGVTPAAFFEEKDPQPLLTQQAIDGMNALSEKDRIFVLSLIERLKNGY